MSRPPRPGLLLLAVAGLVLLLKGLVLDLAVVEGSSMEPSLAAGQVVLLFRAAYGLRLPPELAPRGGYLLSWAEPRAGEVVAARNPQDGEPVVKRVAAAGPLLLRATGGRLAWPGHSLSLDGRLRGEGSEYPLAAGEYFLAGDNGPESLDSRDYGPLPLALIAGRLLGAPGAPSAEGLAGGGPP